ncbi:PREDICTED: L-aminoadipate-semialdehyde dehydrogenase-phosphopantetheinyl transferase-like [Priapulus caudatus]|uniref:L-aminoadipate-semialdehyde dehydrogenase-phosphopantetheinyl transferase n=1 Tax=Priapulus caudatus TaxID=37621 RepID=A0ABM1EMC9_PRICU|nr:PREDICTED: L-aminoadipate-semialdehyde dehydrogenase-phosphopantetheinyl transferase-like [Priapulus caudatus]
MVRLTMGSIRWAFNFGKWKPLREEWLLAAQSVQLEENQRIHKFVFRKDAKAALVGRLLLRKVIAEKLDIPWQKVKLVRTEKGKPILEDTEDHRISFNIAHQGDYTVLASEMGPSTVGIDVMKAERPNGIKGLKDFFRLMRRQYTDHEWVTILKNPDEQEQLCAFYRLWCLKESYIKAVGIGIGFELKRMEFHIYSPEVPIGQVILDTRSLQTEDMTEFTMPNFTHLGFSHLVDTAESLLESEDSNWENFTNKPENPSDWKRSTAGSLDI